jgi:hypothetical protein
MFSSGNQFTGLSGMLGQSNSNFNPSQADTDKLFGSLGIGSGPIKKPVKAVKKAASNMGLNITLGGGTPRLIRKDNKAGNISDPVQYTMNLINKAKTQNMSNSQKWVNQPANPANPNYTGTTPQRLPLGTSMVQPYISQQQEQSLNRATNPLFMDLGMMKETRNSNQQFMDRMNPPTIAGAKAPNDFSSFFGGNGQAGQDEMWNDSILFGDNGSDTSGSGEFDEWDSNSYADPTVPQDGTSAYDNSRSTNPNAIDAYSEDWMSDYNTGNVPTAEELRASGINLNKLRNAIATGMIDPYNLGVGSNIPFTYDQLKGIEGGLAKSMDPAITDIQARISTADKRETADGGFAFGQNPILDNLVATGKLTKSQVGYIQQAVAAGQNPTDLILSLALEKMGSQITNKVYELQQTKNSLSNIQPLLDQYYANGGKTNIFKGTMESVQRRLGETTDPKLVGITTSLAESIQKYRNAVSGTAYSEQEGKDINSIFPSPKNTREVNNAIIKARISNLDNTLASYYDTALGGPGLYNQLTSAGSTSGSTGSSGSNQLSSQEIQQLQSMGYSQEEINSLQGFRGVGGGTNKASNVSSLQDAMRRIARNESDGSGGYKAVGPKITNPKSMYKGQRAIGKYQVMQGNIGPWSKEILGRSVTPTEFYNNPALQEKIVAGKMQQIYKKYGNWADVASVWFTGGPRSTGANKKDVLGTSGAQYVNKFLS